MTSRTLALAAILSCLYPLPCSAERTPLLRVDLKTGKKVRIDPSGPKSDVDRELDAVLAATSGKAFSTGDLERIEGAVRRLLRATRPRSEPRLLLFVYPGHITRARLTELREILIEIDLVVDPCGRSDCCESVAKHLEILGRSMRQAVIRTRDYVIRFKTITVRVHLDGGQGEHEVFRFEAEEIVRAAAGGAGYALVRRVAKQKAGYLRKMTRAIAGRLRLRRVALTQSPSLSRSAAGLDVLVGVRSDRVRYQRHVHTAFIAAMEALRADPLTPPTVALKVSVEGATRGARRRVFSCRGRPLIEHLDGRLSVKALWDSYVIEQGQKGHRMTFSEGERGGDSDASGPDRTPQILAEKVSVLAPCLTAELSRNGRFRGVTLVFSVARNGRAQNLRTEGRSSSHLLRCLRQALAAIPFQRHGQAPRAVRFPLYLRP